MSEAKSKNIKLMAAMVRAGLTGRDLATRCGISPVTVSHTLNQRVKPNHKTALRMAEALESTPARLGLGRDGGSQ